MPERLRFERELGDLGLREYYHAKLTTEPQEVVVGEQIVLDLNKLGFTGALIDSARWVVQDYIVFYYAGDRKGALLVEPSKPGSPISSKTPLTFYWVNARDGRKVWCEVTERQGSVKVKKKFSITFNVKGPIVNDFDAVPSSPKLISERGKWRISFGDKKKAGIAWNWKVTMPEKHSGFLKDLQLVKRGRKKTKLLDPTSGATQKMEMMDPGGDKGYLLDIGKAGDEECKDLDEWKEPKYSFVRKVGAGKPFFDEFSFDSPSDGLETVDINYLVDEHFQYYILFKPDKPNSIWVPVAMAEWFWQADAVRSGSGWVLNSKSGGIKPGGKGAATTKFPLYKTNTCANQWCEIKADGSAKCL